METITEVKERPILFSTPMVKAILEGRKTLTRRAVTMYNSSFGGTIGGWPALDFSDASVDGDPGHTQYLHVSNPEWETRHRVFPKWDVSDILWVRETFSTIHYIGVDEKPTYIYKADDGMDGIKRIWKPSLFMPKEACRIRLQITSIRVERLHDITEEDAIKEGVESEEWEWGPTAFPDGTIDKSMVGTKTKWFKDYTDHKDGRVHWSGSGARESFRTLWTKINGRESWDANPFVWVINFKKL